MKSKKQPIAPLEKAVFYKTARFYIKMLILAIFILLAGSGFRRCYHAYYQYQFTHTSPNGSNTIIIRYDPMCCPAILKKGRLWNKVIWRYSGSGLIETSFFDVRWLSENEIQLNRGNETLQIKISD